MSGIEKTYIFLKILQLWLEIFCYTLVQTYADCNDPKLCCGVRKCRRQCRSFPAFGPPQAKQGSFLLLVTRCHREGGGERPRSLHHQLCILGLVFHSLLYGTRLSLTRDPFANKWATDNLHTSLSTLHHRRIVSAAHPNPFYTLLHDF